VALVVVVENLEAHQLVDVVRRQRGLIELHAELLHPYRGYADHKSPSKVSDSIGRNSAAQWLFAEVTADPASQQLT
jgi:hypothetical protein